jgi:hypothetical protein
MSSEIFNVIEALSLIVTSVILALGAYRATRIGRAFVNPLYRSRARWTAGVLVLLAVAVFGDLISPPSSSLPALITLPSYLMALEDYVGLAIVGFIAAIFVSVDRTILATMDMDFFHRTALGWPKVRIPFYILMFVAVVESLGNSYLGGLPLGQVSTWEIYAVGSIPTGAYSWFPLFVFALLALIYGYSAAAMVIGARRTPDRTLRKHVRSLGTAIISFFIAIVTLTFTSYTLASDPAVSLVPDFLLIVTGYLFYQVTMSLSPLGRVERDLVAASESGVASSS